MENLTDATFTKTTNGTTATYSRAMVGLHGKVHHAHPGRTVRNGAGERISQPLCGQRSSRFYPHFVLTHFVEGERAGQPIEVTCEKCLNAHPVEPQH